MAHTKYNNAAGVYIEEPDVEFSSQAKMSLNILLSRPVGVRLLAAISDAYQRRGNKVVIAKAPLCTAAYTDDISEKFLAKLRQPGTKHLTNGALKKVTKRGKGCSAIAYWSPSNKIMGSNETRPAYLPLAHELIHCMHYMTGDCAREPTYNGNWDDDSGLAEEEARTIGIGAYQWPANALGPCENEFREAFGFDLRTEYIAGKTLAGAHRTY